MYVIDYSRTDACIKRPAINYRVNHGTDDQHSYPHITIAINRLK